MSRKKKIMKKVAFTKNKKWNKNKIEFTKNNLNKKILKNEKNEKLDLKD